MRYWMTLALISLCSCSSAPKYERMPTIDDKLNNQDHQIQNGMAITNKGSVLDVTVEEVQAQKKRIIAEKAELEQALKNLREDLQAAELENRTLRMHLGLAPVKPKAKSDRINAEGNLIGFKPAPTIEEELEARKAKRAPASVPSTVTEPAQEPIDSE